MFMFPKPAQVLASALKMYFKFWLHWSRKDVQTSDQQPETGGPDAISTSVGWGAAGTVPWVWAKGSKVVALSPAIWWGRSGQNAREVAAFLKVWLNHKRSISTLELWSRKMSEQRISITPMGLKAEPGGCGKEGPAPQEESCWVSQQWDHICPILHSCWKRGRGDTWRSGWDTWKEWHSWHGPFGSSRSLVFPSSVMETVGDGLGLFSFGNVVARQLFYTL